MDLALMRPWVGVLVFFCITMVPSVSEGSCIANGKFKPDTMMRMIQVTLVKGNILQMMVEKAMKTGDNNKMIKGIKGLQIVDLNIPGTNITLKPNGEICANVTINITVAGKSFIGGHMNINLCAKLIMCGKISVSDGFVIIKVILCKVEVLFCKTNLPSSMLPKIVNKFLDSTLAKVMPGVLCPAADMMMEKQMAAFKSMLGKKAIGTIGFVTYDVAEKPSVHASHISLSLRLKIENKNGEPIAFTCEPLPDNLAPGEGTVSMVYLPGSALNIYMRLAQTHLNTVLTKVKGSVPTSDQLKKMMPKVSLPGGKKLKVKITHTENPKVSVTSSANSITTTIEASFLDAKRSNQYLSITMKHQCSATFTIQQEHLVISLKAGGCRTLEVSSAAGDVTGATKYLETVIESWIPIANAMFKKNQIPLPSMMNVTSTTEEPKLRFAENLLILEKDIPPYSDAEVASEMKKQCNKIKL